MRILITFWIVIFLISAFGFVIIELNNAINFYQMPQIFYYSSLWLAIPALILAILDMSIGIKK